MTAAVIAASKGRQLPEGWLDLADAFYKVHQDAGVLRTLIDDAMERVHPVIKAEKGLSVLMLDDRAVEGLRYIVDQLNSHTQRTIEAFEATLVATPQRSAVG